MFQHPDPKQIFASELPELRKHAGFRRDVADALATIRATQPREVYRALIDGQDVPDEVWDELGDVVACAFECHARPALTLEWDSRAPMGGDGFTQVLELRGVYVCVSTDWESDGPYSSVELAATCYESFAQPTNFANLSSKRLSMRELCELVDDLGLPIEELDEFTVNGHEVRRNDDGYVVPVRRRPAKRAAAAAPNLAASAASAPAAAHDPTTPVAGVTPVVPSPASPPSP